MQNNLKLKISLLPKKNNQQGVTLLLALLVLSAISAIAFSLAAIVLVEIRASGDLLRTEPALYAVQGLTEQAFFKYSTGAPVTYPSSVNNVSLTTSALKKYDDSPRVDVISTFKTYELINPDTFGPSGYTSFQVTFLDNGLGSTITVAATEINPGTSSQTVLNPQLISRGGTGYVPVNPAYIYEITITNNSTSQNATVSIATTRQGGPPNGLPFINKKVIDVTASYTNFTRKYTVSIPTSSGVSSGSAVNVAAAANGSVASASSVFSGSYAPSGAIDGDRKGLNWGSNGGWNDATSDTFPDWLEVDFPGSKTISEIDVFTVQDNYNSPSDPTAGMIFTLYGITDFQVQYWNGASWAAVPNGNINSNSLVWNKVTFSSLSTTKIRVNVTNALNSYSRITELEAY